MPYVTQERRRQLDPLVDFIALKDADLSAGDLNYLITRLAITMMESKRRDYATANDIHGALDCAGKEFYRRVVAPYEDRKVALNGDVYPYWMTLPCVGNPQEGFAKTL